MMHGSSISRASVEFKAERGLGTVRGGRSPRVSCYVRSVVPSHDRLKGLARNCGGADPSKRPENPQKLYRSLRVGNSELTSIASAVSEPSWLEGAELSGPPEL